MKRLLILALFSLSVANLSYAQGRALHLYGTVTDAKTGETVIGAVIYNEDKQFTTITNDFGHYDLQLKGGCYKITCSCLGFLPQTVDVDLSKGSVNLNFVLEVESRVIEGAKVVAQTKRDALMVPQMGMNTMQMTTVKKVPALLGENDVIRAIQMLPGVQSPSEGSTGFSVRGGGIDQNLILMDGAPVYNSGHFLGFISMFNSDAVKMVKLYKGDLPAHYGEKAASVLDVSTNDGNFNGVDGNISIGLLTSKFLVEAPIVKSKLAFSLSARRSYVDLFFPLMKGLVPDGTQLYFGDINGKLSWIINDNNRLSASVFSSKDQMGIALADMGVDLMAMNYRNNVQSIKWSHIFSPDLTTTLTAYNTIYDMGTKVDMEQAGYTWESGIDELGLKNGWTWHINPNNILDFGANIAYFRLAPSDTYPAEGSSILQELSPKTYALQPSLYVQNEQKIRRLTLRYGLRMMSFVTMGETDQYYFDPVTHETTEIRHFGKGEKICSYYGLDPRVSLSFALSDKSSLKASYSRTHQFIQQTSISISPGVMDIWYSASPNVKPHITDQVSAGWNRNFLDDRINLTLEAYYKHGLNTPDLQDNPGSVVENLEREGLLRFGTSDAYGIELMAEYELGNFSGWVNYTWSRAMNKIPEINDGKPYRSPLNHEHSVNIVCMYNITKRLEASASWVFYSGAPTSYPVARYKFGNSYVPLYSDKNADSMPDYHRLDLSLTLKGKKSLTSRRWAGEWNFSIYNAYGRHNAWSIASGYNRTSKRMETQLVYLFSVVPSVSYTLHF